MNWFVVSEFVFTHQFIENQREIKVIYFERITRLEGLKYKIYKCREMLWTMSGNFSQRKVNLGTKMSSGYETLALVGKGN